MLIGACFFAIRHCIDATWLNDRDQFLFPNDGWKSDIEFQTDCLAYTLFHGQNNIRASEGTNHWIPFTEKEVNAQEKFESHFMTDFIKGKNRINQNHELFDNPNQTIPDGPLSFSIEAKSVFDAGRDLWRYYHAQPNANPNAAFYDIRLYFQGTNDKGKMNPDSTDKRYTKLIGELRNCMKLLGKKIEPKVYEYGFLLK